MGTAATADVQSLPALTLVLTPQQAAGLAVGGSADLLAAGGNTITAGDGNNIVFANFGRIVTVDPVNYLRNRGDFIDAAAPVRWVPAATPCLAAWATTSSGPWARAVST
ncbi:hypothetical protein G6F31_020683 [Rhizopus arrhizus]|nr:hypothetical protein G6F31_020683 [Rhizopus arrhizus]